MNHIINLLLSWQAGLVLVVIGIAATGRRKNNERTDGRR